MAPGLALRPTLGTGAWQPWREADVGSQLSCRTQAPANRQAEASGLSEMTAIRRPSRSRCAPTSPRNALLSRIVKEPFSVRRALAPDSPQLPGFASPFPVFHGEPCCFSSVVKPPWTRTAIPAAQCPTRALTVVYTSTPILFNCAMGFQPGGGALRPLSQIIPPLTHCSRHSL